MDEFEQAKLEAKRIADIKCGHARRKEIMLFDPPFRGLVKQYVDKIFIGRQNKARRRNAKEFLHKLGDFRR